MLRQFEVLGSQQVNHNLLCSICKEVFYNPIRATCGHTFCGTCLIRWIQQKMSCPICRHQLQRNFYFDKDILAAKIVGDIQIKCLRCQEWNGTIALFKQHKLKQCKFIKINDVIPSNVIEILDEDISYSFIIAKSPILVQIPEQGDESNQDIQILETRQNNIQNDKSQLEINHFILDDQSNDIVEETSDNLQEEESSQPESQIVVSPNYQQYIDLDKSDIEDIQNIQNQQNLSQDVNINPQEKYIQSSQAKCIFELQENITKHQKMEQQQQLLNDSENEISFNNRDMKEIKSTRKFRLNIQKNTLSVAEPLIDSMNDQIFYEFIDHMEMEMKNKLNSIFNTLI